ncbi:MAG: hypothetical protein ACPGEG_02215 [Salibacteraceae bacterium]
MKAILKKYKRLILTGILVLSVLLFFPLRSLFFDYADQLLYNTLSGMVNKQTKGEYSFNYEGLRYNVFKQRFQITEFNYFPIDSNKLKNRDLTDRNSVDMAVNIELLEIHLNNQFEFFFSNTLTIDHVVVESPHVEVTMKKVKKSDLGLGKIAGNLYELVTQYLYVFELKNLEVNNAEMLYHIVSKDFQKDLNINEFSFKVKDFILDKNQSFDESDNPLFTDNFELNSGYQSFELPDSLHEVSFDRFRIALKEERITFHNIRINPIDGRDTTTRNTMELFLPNLKFDRVDFEKAYRQNSIDLQKLSIDRPAIKLRLFARNKKRNEDDSLSFTDSKVASLLKEILVEKLVLTKANVLVDYYDQKHLKREFLVNGLTYKCNGLQLDSSFMIDYKIEGLTDNFNLQIFELKHEVPDNGLLVRAFNLGYSSITRDFEIDGLFVQPNEKKIRRSIRQKKQQMVLRKMEIEKIEISELDLEKLVDKQKGYLGTSKIVRPQIELLFDTAYVKNDSLIKVHTESLMATLFDSLGTEDFEIDGANISILNAHNPKEEFGKIEKADVYIPNADFQYLADKPDWIEVLDRSAISTGNSFFEIPGINHRVSWAHTDYSSAKEQFLFNSINYSGQNKENSISTRAKTFKVKGFSFDKFLKQKNYQLDYVEYAVGSLEFHETDKSKLNGKEVKVPHFEIGQLSIQSIDLLHTLKDSVRQRIDRLTMNASNLKYKVDSLNKTILQLSELNMAGQNGFVSIDKNRHYLELKQFDLSTQDSIVNLTDVQIKPVLLKRVQGDNTVMRSSINNIQIDGFVLGEYHVLDNLHANRIDICEPEFRMNTKLDKKAPQSGKSFVELHEWFSEITGIKQVKYNMLNIEKGLVDMVFQGQNKQAWTTSIMQYNLAASNFILDSNQRMSDEKLFYADRYVLDLYNVNQLFPSELRDMQIGHLQYNSQDQYVKLESTNFNYMIYSQLDSSRELFLDANVPLLELEGVKPLQIMDSRKLNLRRVHLVNPKIEITQFHKNTDYVSRELSTEENGNDEVAIKNLIFDELDLENGNITWDFEDTSKYSVQFNHVNLAGTDLKMEEKSSKPQFGEIELSFGNFKHDVLDKFYDLELDSLYVNSKSKELKIQGASLSPRYGIFEFANKSGWDKGRLEFYSPNTSVSGLDLKKLIYENDFNASLVLVDSLWVRSFKNKKLPPNYRNIPLPAELLANSTYGINVDSLSLEKGFVEHRQLSKNGIKNGTIKLTGLKATINNITNDSLALEKNNKSQLSASATLYDQGTIDADMQFYLTEKDNRFTVDATVSSFDGKSLNEYLEHTAFIRIRKGQVNGAQLNFAANDKRGIGEMKLLYKNLHVDFLNHDTSKNKSMGLLMKTFLANRVVNNQNPHFFITKTGDIYYKRDTSKAVFQYWTMLAMSGVASSTGIHNNRKERKKVEKEIKNLKKEELRREKAIRRREEEELEREQREKEKAKS